MRRHPRKASLLAVLVAGVLTALTLTPATVGTAGAGPGGPLAGWRHERVAPGVDLYRGVLSGTPGSDFWTVTLRQDGAQLLPAAQARTLAERLRAAGFAPRVEPVSWPAGADRHGVLGHRVRVGTFGGQNQADNRRAALREAGFDAVTDWTGGDGTPGTGLAQVAVAVIDPHRFRGSLAGDTGEAVAGRDTVTSIAGDALLAVNAGFFVVGTADGIPGAPAGIAAYDGRLQGAATNGRVAMILRGDGLRPEFRKLSTELRVRAGSASELVDGVNRVPGRIRNCGGVGGDEPTQAPLHDVTCTDPDEIVRFTPELGAGTPAGPGVEAVLDGEGRVLALRERGGAVPQGGSVLAGTGQGEQWLREHATAGTRLAVTQRITDEQGREVRLGPDDDIVNGGPTLVRDGRVAVEFGADGIERAGDPTFAYAWGIKRNPRTFAGIDRAGRVLLVASAGRQPGYSDGLGLAEGARFLRSLGAVEAMNLDGGGSTAMVAGGERVTMPSDATGERPVGDALVLRR